MGTKKIKEKNMDSLVYWIWLSLACIPGSKAFGDLMKRFSDAY